jgi:anti-sigma B factor antagonist
MLKLSVEELLPGVRVIMVTGELDMLSAPTLEQSINHELAGGLHGLILNLDELTFLGSAGVLVLIRAQEAAQSENASLRLVCNSRAVLRTLEICGVLERFGISETLDDAQLRLPTCLPDRGTA